VLKMLLSGEHPEYEILEAIDGSEAVEKYQEYVPNLVLMDILMPKMNGMEASRRILQYDSRAKIIMLTAVEHDESMHEAIRIGVKGYLRKPLDIEELLYTAEKVLNPIL